MIGFVAVFSCSELGFGTKGKGPNGGDVPLGTTLCLGRDREALGGEAFETAEFTTVGVGVEVRIVVVSLVGDRDYDKKEEKKRVRKKKCQSQ